MGRTSYEDYLRKQYPQIDEVAKLYADLGFEDSIGWASQELKGKKNTVALALLTQALRAEVMPADDATWIDKVLASDLNIDDGDLVSEASEALRRVQERGVDPTLLTPLIRAFQTEVVRNIVSLLDEGSRLCTVQPPPGREADWELVALDADRNQIGPISGLHELVDL
jgi:hypothetical protein